MRLPVVGEGTILEQMLEVLLMGFNDAVHVGGGDREESRVNPRSEAPVGFILLMPGPQMETVRRATGFRVRLSKLVLCLCI